MSRRVRRRSTVLVGTVPGSTGTGTHSRGRIFWGILRRRLRHSKILSVLSLALRYGRTGTNYRRIWEKSARRVIRTDEVSLREYRL
jgi:hypothetical protein